MKWLVYSMMNACVCHIYNVQFLSALQTNALKTKWRTTKQRIVIILQMFLHDYLKHGSRVMFLEYDQI